MKSFFKITGIILFNSFLICCGIFFNAVFTNSILKATEGRLMEGFFWIPYTIAAIIFYWYYVERKYIRWFGIGTLVLFGCIAVFLIFFTNRSLLIKGEYTMLEQASVNDFDIPGLGISYNGFNNWVEVEQEDCIKVDSVLVKTGRGIFGMNTMTDEVKIVEQTVCREDTIQKELPDSIHFAIAEQFAYRRCFSQSIKHYTACIDSNPHKSKPYDKRGLMYLVKREYKKALADFEVAKKLNSEGVIVVGNMVMWEGQDFWYSDHLDPRSRNRRIKYCQAKIGK